MKRLLAVLMVCLMVAGCSGGKLVIDKGKTESYKDMSSNFEVTINSMELKGDEVKFNATIRNLGSKPLDLSSSYFAVGFITRAETNYSKGALMPGESVSGDATIKDKWEKGDHSISFSTGFMSQMKFDFKIK